MIGMAIGKKVFTAVFVLLALAYSCAAAAPELSPGQQFFFETVAARRSVRSFKSDEGAWGEGAWGAWGRCLTLLL